MTWDEARHASRGHVLQERSPGPRGASHAAVQYVGADTPCELARLEGVEPPTKSLEGRFAVHPLSREGALTSNNG